MNLSTLCQASLKGAQYIKEKGNRATPYTFKFCEFILVQAMSQSEEVFATPDQPLAFVSGIECQTLCYEK